MHSEPILMDRFFLCLKTGVAHHFFAGDRGARAERIGHPDKDGDRTAADHVGRDGGRSLPDTRAHGSI